MHKVQDIITVIEEAAPLCAQAAYDNSGLVVGRHDSPVSGALLCLDVTDQIMDEAQSVGADMIISHHPVIFNGLKKLNGYGYAPRIVERAIKEGLTLYACHTNLDAIPGGMSFRAGAMLGLDNVRFLAPDSGGQTGYGIVGSLKRPMHVMPFLQHVKEVFSLEVLRHSDIHIEEVRTVALCTGSGASLTDNAIATGADIYLAGDFKYHDFLEADRRILIADIGHYESEICAVDLLYEIIRKKIATFALCKSKCSRNPVNYLL